MAAQQPFIRQYIEDWTPDVKAASDLRSFQFFPVQYDGGGVRLACGDPSSGAYWILTNQPNSGQFCGLAQSPTVMKVVCASQVARNQFVVVPLSGFGVGPANMVPITLGTSGSFIIASGATIIGRALTATVNGSGELIAVKLGL